MPVLVGYLLLFLTVAIGFIFVHLLAGKLVRPARPSPEKGTVYECGEPTVGSAWVQFDLRYYVVALLFVIFDVEVAFFFPWAVVFGQVSDLARPDRAGEGVTAASQAAARTMTWVSLAEFALFFGALLVGFAYLWRRGDLEWVRGLPGQGNEKAVVGPHEVRASPVAEELVGNR